MTLIKKVNIFALAIALILMLSSCAVESEFYGGAELDDAKISEIKSSVWGTEQTKEVSTSDGPNQEESVESSEMASEDESLTSEDTAELVYWTKNGQVWHYDRDCRYIKKSDVVSGSVDAAVEAGKDRACSSCGK